MSRDPYRLLLLSKTKLSSLDTQKTNWQTLNSDCKNELLKEFTTQELNDYINNTNNQ